MVLRLCPAYRIGGTNLGVGDGRTGAGWQRNGSVSQRFLRLGSSGHGDTLSNGENPELMERDVPDYTDPKYYNEVESLEMTIGELERFHEGLKARGVKPEDLDDEAADEYRNYLMTLPVAADQKPTDS